MNVTVFRTIWNLSRIVIFYYLIIMSDFFMTFVHYVNDSKLRISRMYNIHIFWKYSTKKETITRTYVKLFVSILGTYKFQFVDDDRFLTIPLYLSQQLYDWKKESFRCSVVSREIKVGSNTCSQE